MNARIQGYKKKRDVLLIDRTSLFYFRYLLAFPEHGNRVGDSL
jgi:hypothetical protein